VIGVVTTSYPRFPDDGAGGFVGRRVRALRAQGAEVEVIAAGDGPDDGGAIRVAGRGLFYAGGAPETLEDARLSTRMAAWGRALAFSGALAGEVAVRGRRWQAVESHWLLPCGLVVCAALPGLPHRAHLHGGDVYLLGRLPWADAVARVLCRSRPELVFASRSLRGEFSRLLGAAPETFGARSRVEPAPIDPFVFKPRTDEERRLARAELGLSGRTLLAAGRLVPIKGHALLVAAVATLPATLRPQVIIAGEGPERGRLARAAQAAGVSLRLPGQVAPAELARFMAAADLFVHPSRPLPSGRSEGMPLVVREALARGLPVLATATGGLEELRGSAGLTLLAPGDTARLAAAIAREGLSPPPE
jgi:glycosyltransferase involved in cell wall biosynthesis